MPRLINSVSGVVINVSDTLAATLDSKWKPFGEVQESAPAPKRKTVRKDR